MTEGEIEFLKESNAIEGVWDVESLKNAQIAWEYIKNQPQLHPSNIKRVHRLLMRGKLDKKYLGHYRDCPVRVKGGKVAPVGLLRMLMKKWALDANRKDMTEQDIAQHHIKYEFIHPFIDGNGQTGRIFMNWQRIRNGYPILTTKARKPTFFMVG